MSDKKTAEKGKKPARPGTSSTGAKVRKIAEKKVPKKPVEKKKK